MFYDWSVLTLGNNVILYCIVLKTTNNSTSLDSRTKTHHRTERQENLEWEGVIGSQTRLLQAGSAFHISMKIVCDK